MHVDRGGVSRMHEKVVVYYVSTNITDSMIACGGYVSPGHDSDQII